MAVSTLTASPYLQVIRGHHHSNEISGKVTLSGRTLSDIIFLGKVPNGALITGWNFFGTHGDTARTFKLGITGGSAASETAFGTVTWTTLVLTGQQGCPFRVSISDTDAQAGATIYATIATGTWTTSASFEYSFRYRMDTPAP
jgi:hypothetical protein